MVEQCSVSPTALYPSADVKRSRDRSSCESARKPAPLRPPGLSWSNLADTRPAAEFVKRSALRTTSPTPAATRLFSTPDTRGNRRQNRCHFEPVGTNVDTQRESKKLTDAELFIFLVSAEGIEPSTY